MTDVFLSFSRVFAPLPFFRTPGGVVFSLHTEGRPGGVDRKIQGAHSGNVAFAAVA